jgi:hypothetical protein
MFQVFPTTIKEGSEMLSLFKKFQTYCCLGIATILLSLTCAAAYAASPEGKDHANLGEQATNPVASLMSFRFQYQNSPSNYNADSYSQAAIAQAVIPVPLPFEYVPMLITRTTIPFINTADLGEDVHKKSGFSDTAVLALFIPDFGLKGHAIAIGPSIGIPTAGDNEFTGSGKWTLGPALGYVNTNTKGWQWGGLLYQDWNVASTRSDAGSVNKTRIEPILNYHFGSKGWYVGLPDLPQTYDHETNNWTTNFGGVLGRVFSWRKQHLQVFGGAYYNSEDNDDEVAGQWKLKLNLSFLIPE